MTNVVCMVNIDSDRATFRWSEGPASFRPYTLERIVYHEFRETAELARSHLAALANDYHEFHDLAELTRSEPDNLANDYLDAEANFARAAYELARTGLALSPIARIEKRLV